MCVTFMVGGAVRGGEGGQSAAETFEMVRSSCLLKIKIIITNNHELFKVFTSKKKQTNNIHCISRHKLKFFSTNVNVNSLILGLTK